MSFAFVSPRIRPVSKHRVPARAARPSVRSLAVFCTLFLGSATLLPGVLHAQTPGSLDTSFFSSASSTTIFTVTTTTATDGAARILTGGDETQLAELKTNGSVASNFTEPGFGNLNRRVYTIVPDTGVAGVAVPEFLVGGLFGKGSSNTNATSQNITRINVNGTIDATFVPGAGANDYVTAIVPLNDAGGSIMAAGLFTTFDKRKYPHLVRLTRTGGIDSGFSSVPLNDGVFAMAPQIDPALGTANPLNPQVLIGGTFTAIGNDSYSKLARVDFTGEVDSTFRPEFDERVLAIATQPDGKIVVGGQFMTVNGQTVGHLARLNQDGSLDPSFNASVSVVPDGTVAPVAVYVLKLLPDGRIYVGGNFSAVDGTTRHYLARINSDGSLDKSFDPGRNITNSVQTVAIQSDNRVLVGETVDKKIDNVFPPSLIRLYGDPVPSVNLSVPVATARTGPAGNRKVGAFEFTRSAVEASEPLTVYFTLSGTALDDNTIKPLAVASYSTSISQVTFPANVTKLRLKVKPRNKTIDADNLPETVILTPLLSPDPAVAYDLNSSAARTIKVLNMPGS